MAGETATKRARRSPNYPQQPLNWAVETGLKLLDKEGVHAVPPDVVAANLGYKDANNGSAARVLANLKAFGIIQKAPGGKLVVSKDVQRFKLHPADADRAALIHQWLNKPLLFSKLLEKYDGNLPSDRALVFELVDEHGFLESAAQSAIEVFRASLKYAEQFSAGVTNDVAQEDAVEDEHQEIEVAVAAPPKRSSVPAPVHVGSTSHSVPVAAVREGVRYPIRLAGGRMAWIEVPDPFYEADKKRLEAQLAIIGTVDEDNEF
ncbi:hypothetical protein [Thiorhodococcus drewsii]|nr:hypothetical protein [Thiorhodococcus drewsii]